VNSAHAVSLLDGHPHVAVLAPYSAPGVAHNPVLLPLVTLAVTYQQHGMVQLVAALGRVEDSALVHLENRLVGLDGH